MGGDGGRGPAFFLSYARADAKNWPELIDSLFDDLSRNVAQYLGPSYKPAFRDTDTMEPGSQWRGELKEALGTAHAFVALLTRTYFSSEYCGREWAAFANRIEKANSTPDASKLMQPVMLTPKTALKPLPDVISDTQLTFDRYPDLYADRGINYLHQLQSQRDSYNEFVLELTQLLVQAIETTQLPAHDLPPLDRIQSAFHVPGTNKQRQAESGVLGPLVVQFVYVAARQGELGDLRQDDAPYSESGRFWRPYHPPDEVEVAMLAHEVAAREQFRDEDLELDEGFEERLREAARDNKVLVALVDPWTVRLEAYNELMSALDRYNFPGCVVIVSMNDTDPESVHAAGVLRQAIEATFVIRHTATDPSLAVLWVTSPDHLREELAKALAEAKLRVIATRQRVFDARAAGIFRSPPIVSATAG